MKSGVNKRAVLMEYNFVSSEDFANFASTHDMFVSNKAGAKKGAVRSLADAQRVADGDFIVVSTPLEVLEQRVGKLDSHVKNSSDGQEYTTTRAIASCPAMRKEFGELRVINNGYPVLFYNDNGDEVLQADGLVMNSVVLLLNEVKHKPTSADACLQQGRARTLEGILSNASAFRSEPAHILPELERAGIKTVQPVLSGYNFASSVEEDCAKADVLVMKTNGSDYSNTA